MIVRGLLIWAIWIAFFVFAGIAFAKIDREKIAKWFHPTSWILLGFTAISWFFVMVGAVMQEAEYEAQIVALQQKLEESLDTLDESISATRALGTAAGRMYECTITDQNYTSDYCSPAIKYLLNMWKLYYNG